MRARATFSMAWLPSMPIARSLSGRQKLDHAAGAGAEIEHGPERPGSDGVEHRRFDLFLGHMQGPNAIPVRGLCRKIEFRRGHPGGPHLVEARPVGAEHRVMRIEPAQDVAGKACRGAPLAGREEGPGTLAVAFHQPGFHQQLEMPRHAGLRLAQDRDEFADRQFGLGQQGQQTKPGAFASRLQGRQGRIEGQVMLRHRQLL